MKLRAHMENVKSMPADKKSRIKTFVAIGLVFLGVCVLVTIFYLRPAMRLAYVDSAIVTLRVVFTAEKQYAQAHPERGYACEFSDLDLNELPQGFAKSRQRNGYAFELVCIDGTGDAVHQGFQVMALPFEEDMAAYCTDQSGIVKYDNDGSTAKCLRSVISL